VNTTNVDEFTRINMLMDCGDEARETAEDNAILALGVAAKITEIRASIPQPHRKLAFIVSSLKRPEEVRCLREIYPRAFYMVGVHSDESRRERYLVEEKRIQAAQAKQLILRDENEDDDHGQRLSDTFHMADFFVRVDGLEDRLRESLWRILDILFGAPDRTPTFDEYAMFLAFSASLRSADLSRQVGAVIAKGYEVLGTGANDCPKATGGLYWPELNTTSQRIEDAERGRDYKRGFDSNKREQQKMIDEIVADAGNEILDLEALRRVLERSRIRDLTEFGRVVHAEMEALLSCVRKQISTLKATIYCTTFPCHNCAKHIIAAGIKRVVFVEPYQKSKAAEFHDDAIIIGFDNSLDPEAEDEKVRFEPFVGVGPRRFFDLFSMKLGLGYELQRKNKDGSTKEWRPETAVLRVQMLPFSYLDLEGEASTTFARFRVPAPNPNV
jgi:deoxycytidylate deaminase